MRSTLRSSAARVAVVLAATIAALALASACSDEEIVLATVPSSEGGSREQLKRCVVNTDCSATMFCSRRDCDDVGGTCEPRPVVCDEAPMPVCGCDGITYWNDCLRRTVGATVMRPGECSDTARLCGRGSSPPGPGGPGSPGPETCPPGLSCARLLPPDLDITMPALCPPDLPGTCWALPAICPERGGPDRWISCDPTKSFCASTCEAIRSGEPHKRATACP
jgi:hypothetical protein